MKLFERLFGASCDSCSSKIDHFGQTNEDLIKLLSCRGRANEKERAEALMRQIGGRCAACGKVCCSNCYLDHGEKCPACGATISYCRLRSSRGRIGYARPRKG